MVILYKLASYRFFALQNYQAKPEFWGKVRLNEKLRVSFYQLFDYVLSATYKINLKKMLLSKIEIKARLSLVIKQGS